ncbi:UDP-glucose--tetrahydrobiopterin glucosyltransferase [Hydrococcus rivularis NIES-593]|uniref:UDP-glucose--tetrahydrobiopterin glucosyltransferase n=1 Tax=Hydrococcus rivularis NIES-593 TaxID=1921803 RepID=A0A1U7HE99_9CYAN|nr:glycosyltransferase family 4 protein [Hydrococcus rivularis]OKH21900.1 UDP-glucose--tetrahydrobiopterin glucosyltransferase [Hydrococcus rivularis NIES-593]
MKLLFLSTSVGSLGSGLGGGVELTLKNIALAMMHRGHQVRVVAPSGSVLAGIPLTEITGNLQIPAQTQNRKAPICLPDNSVLANMWEYARQVQNDYDLILNFAYDWLPFYLTPFFSRPVAHLVSMASVTAAMDRIIQQTIARFPVQVAFHSRAQAATFGLADSCRCLGNAIDLCEYQFCKNPTPNLAWIGRIAPEKALEDAVAAAQISGISLRIFGKLQDRDYWEKICRDYPNAPMEYVGFLPTHELQQQLRQCRALVMTPRWVEAFGNVAIEALACGVPVIAYRRGGPAEIVRDGETGFLVEPDSVTGLVEAIKRLNEIDRDSCRRQAEEEYSLWAMGDRTEAWFRDILGIGIE